ncbi:MAG: DALR anticodon-binding domain-containing protein [Actinomycetota bacterium]
MLPGDIGAELAAVITAAVAAGDLPPSASLLSAAGTWRPAPGDPPGQYSTSLPFRLAGPGHGARAIAGQLATGLRGRDQISAASATGAGYLTVTVTDAALTRLAVRMATAGPACARSDALAGRTVTAPASVDLVSAVTWAQARQQVTAVAAGRLAAAAGAQVLALKEVERMVPASPGAGAAAGPAGPAVAFTGYAAVGYALVRQPPGRAGGIDARKSVQYLRQNPFFAVTFACRDAAATLRRAAERGLSPGNVAAFPAGALAAPAERTLLSALSWLPERAAAAGRRARPDEFARYLEDLAGAYLDVREICPVVPVGSGGGPGPAAVRARLWLAAAVRTALGTGLFLLAAAPQSGGPEAGGTAAAGGDPCGDAA